MRTPPSLATFSLSTLFVAIAGTNACLAQSGTSASTAPTRQSGANLESTSGLALEDPDGGLSVWVSGGASYQFDADIDSGGDFTVVRAGGGVGFGDEIHEQLSWTAGFRYEFSDYDFSGAGALGGVQPWESVHTVRLSASLQYAFDDQWSVFGGPSVSWSGEEDADFGEAFTGGGVVGFGYRHSTELTLGFGLFVSSSLEEDARVFPFIRFAWQISPEWELRSGPFELGAEGGAGIELGWDFADDLELALGAQYQSRRFRLSEDGPTPDGVGEETSVPVYLRLSWNPSSQAVISVAAGVVAGGELKLDSSSGREIADEDYDPAGFLGINVTLRF